MKDYTKQDILRIVEEEDVEFIRLQFADMFGNLKNVAITVSQLEKALDNKCMFDGSSIEGFVRVEESDMLLYPDLSTFTIFPWRPQQGRVARMICDVYNTSGEAFVGDPRYVLRKAVEEAKELGYEFNVGPELEFFLFDSDEYGQPTTETREQAGYFDMGPNDLGENARRDMIITLEEMDFEVEASHHEAAPGQHEIDFKYDEALATADNIMTFKLAVKTIAKRHGLYASFMPKPKEKVNGSGMHINMSLFKDGINIFHDDADDKGLSQEAYFFMGGILKHMRAMCAITNPLVNSYKRLVPGYEAPVYMTWGTKNRTQLLRIPSDGGNGTRIELRCPDPSANPYLALAVCLKAGIDGIKNGIVPPQEFDGNAFRLTVDERENAGILALPNDLGDAISIMEQDDFMKEILGEHIFGKYIEAKKAEWNRYESQVSQWEIEEYLNKY
ncbi:MAG: type I glutamate--ammonia ligase [Lachnospiraceae bacterium]